MQVELNLFEKGEKDSDKDYYAELRVFHVSYFHHLREWSFIPHVERRLSLFANYHKGYNNIIASITYNKGLRLVGISVI